MPNYRNRFTGDILTGGEVRRRNKNVSFSAVVDTFADLGYDAIQTAPQPAPSTVYKVVHSNGVAQDANGNWVEAWAERDMTQEEIDAYDLSLIPVVPNSVPKWAADQALIDAGMDGLPTTYFATLTGNAKKKAQSAWDKKPYIKRDSPVLLAAIAGGIVTDAQVDALMIAADVIAMTEL